MVCLIKIMKCSPARNVFWIFAAAVISCASARAQFLDEIGVTALRAVTTNLNGVGIRVAQPEAYDSGTTNFEVNPATVGQPVSSLELAVDPAHFHFFDPRTGTTLRT